MIPRLVKIYISLLFILSTVLTILLFPKKADFNSETFIIFIVYILFAIIIKYNTTMNIVIKGININIVIHRDVLLVILTNPFFNFIYLVINEVLDSIKNKDEKWNEKIWFFLYNTSCFNLAGMATFAIFHSTITTREHIGINLIIATLLSVLTYGIINKLLFVPIMFSSDTYKSINFLKLSILISSINVTVNTPMMAIVVYFFAVKEYAGIILILLLDLLITFINKKSIEFTKSIVEADVYKKIAYNDQLTDIYNRHYLNSLLENKSLLNENLGIALIDIDFFKKINDTYNHDVGDQVLKQFARTVAKQLRENDIFIRTGGEEFLILFKNISFKESCSLLEKIRSTIDKQQLTVNFNNENIPLNYTVSAGLYYKTVNNNIDIEKALIEADNRLYSSKHNGRNRITCDNFN